MNDTRAEKLKQTTTDILSGRVSVVEGTRNQTLYEAARDMWEAGFFIHEMFDSLSGPAIRCGIADRELVQIVFGATNHSKRFSPTQGA